MTLRRNDPVITLAAAQWDAYRDNYRDALLEASDDAMTKIIRDSGFLPENGWAKTGARDADLPELFKALDAQFERNMVHAGFWRGED